MPVYCARTLHQLLHLDFFVTANGATWISFRIDVIIQPACSGVSRIHLVVCCTLRPSTVEVFTDPNTRRRALFDTLADATAEEDADSWTMGAGGRFNSFSSVGEQVIVVDRVGAWLRQPKNASFVAECWAVLDLGPAYPHSEPPPPGAVDSIITEVRQSSGAAPF